MNLEQQRAVAIAQARRKRAEAERSVAVVPPEDRRDSRGVPGGPDMAATRPADSPIGEQALDASADVLGAPIDAVNSVLGAIGLPVSETPVGGSDFIGSILHGISGARENRQLGDTPGIQPGGAPLGQRVYSSFLNTDGARDQYLTNEYGPENEGWYPLADRFGNPTERRVVRSEDGTERLFNPPGIDMGDVAGMAGGVPDLVGAIMGSAASVPAYALGPGAGIPASAALSAGGAQLVGETVGRAFPENREAEPSITSDVLPRAAGEAGMDALLSAIFGGAGRLTNAVVNKARAPFAKSSSDPIATEFRQASDRLNDQGYNISPLPSEEGAGGFIPRVEGFLEKLPGSSEKMRQYREQGDQAIARFQQDIAGDANPNQIGRETVGELSTQRKDLVIDREQALTRADDMVDQNQTTLTSRQGPQMSAEGAGRETRAGLERARQEFRDQAKELYDRARTAPGGRDPIVNVLPVREQVQRIREALPPTAKGSPSARFTPQGLSRFLLGVDDIAETITIDQARQMRSLVTDAIDDKSLLPGVPERYLSQLNTAISRSIDDSVSRAGTPELRAALSVANRFYAQNIDRFSRKGVAETYRDPIQAGYVEDNRLVDRLLSGRGNPGVIRETRDLMGSDSAEWAATRRNAVEQILDTGRDQTRYGRKVVNVDGLIERLNRLDDEAVTELFGVADASQLRNLAVDISNRSKYLDASALSQNGTPNILNQLRAAAVADDQIAREYRDGAIAPFLRGEDGAAAKLQPEELVPWLYRRAAPNEAQKVMSKLPAPMKAQVEKGIVADIVENAISRGGGDMSSVRRLITGEANPADSQGIAELLGAGRDAASRQQSERISALVSPENQQALRDLALITARRQERDATTSAVGGLAAGAAITGMLSSPGTAIKGAILSRGLAELITMPGVRRWLSNTRQHQMSAKGQARLAALSPQVLGLSAAALAENSDLQAATEWVNEGLSQIDQAGRRAIRPPEGAESWEEFFDQKP
ncbi:hypothetical protein [Hoeflea sp.]|uniref:hypothetical protein n=1 Tax=Hoeflea sp. TaxID=1940281 RepID=UPI003A8EAE2C